MSMKDELRYRYKVKRKYFQHSQREVADGAVSDALLAAFADRHSFFIYYSFGSEADTHAIIKRLLALGKRVYLPKVFGGEMYAAEYFGREEELKKNSFGIEEPVGEAFTGDIDVCIAPLLAVNEGGFRLGYGGGYYDRFFKSHPGILKVGIGYYLQLTQEHFEDEWDIPLDIYVCERGIYSFGTEQ